MTPKVHNVLFDVWYTIYAPQKHTFQHFPKTQPLTDSTFRPAMAQGQSRYVQRLLTLNSGDHSLWLFRGTHQTPNTQHVQHYSCSQLHLSLTWATLLVFSIAPNTYSISFPPYHFVCSLVVVTGCSQLFTVPVPISRHVFSPPPIRSSRHPHFVEKQWNFGSNLGPYSGFWVISWAWDP